jgi:hypothetical protein
VSVLGVLSVLLSAVLAGLAGLAAGRRSATRYDALRERAADLAARTTGDLEAVTRTAAEAHAQADADHATRLASADAEDADLEREASDLIEQSARLRARHEWLD